MHGSSVLLHGSIFRDVSAAFVLTDTCSLGSLLVVEPCCHIHNVFVKFVTILTLGCAYFPHHDTFNLSLKQFHILVESVSLSRLPAKVIELAHRVNILKADPVC